MVARLPMLGILSAALAAPQAVRVYSEFQRVDPSGAVAAVDRAERPREILSPALARGAWASFIIVVRTPEDKPYWLFIGQNPEHFVKVELYRPVFEQHGDTWLPDALEPVALDDAGRVAPLAEQAPGRPAIVLWMDIWVPANAPVRRARLEVQVKSGEEWTIYPMELRIQEAVIPPARAGAGRLAAVDAPASDTAGEVFRAYACGTPIKGSAVEGPLTIRSMIRRNALQDFALARSLESRMGKEALLAEVLGAGFANAAAFCAAKASPEPGRGAEWYLPIRDRLYRLASVR